ncbi:SGNH/GDSL hydrolase family protein [Roseibium sp.]|uniref:SGNH/GDSL hydrolase family protein n=1 Tax=Roseibium sp. TaxID=1936156 RepID=UPI003BB14EF9
MSEKNTYTVVLPGNPIAEDTLFLIIEKICCAFSEYNTLVFAAPRDCIGRYSDEVRQVLNLAIVEEIEAEGSVFFVATAEWPEHWAEDFKENCLVIDRDLKVSGFGNRIAFDPFGRDMRDSFFGDNSYHLGRSSTVSPYGYTIGSQQFGPIDPSSFRKSLERPASRDIPELKIAVFGGSGVFGSPQLTHNTSPYQLQEKLNAVFEEHGVRLKARVRNYGKEGALLSDSLADYLLHLSNPDDRPDVTILLDGWNDLKAGESIPKEFLLEHDYLFRIDRLDVPKVLQGLAGTLDHNPRPDFQKAHPIDIIRAYINKKEQFARLATSDGSFFIWAQQPFHNFRKKPPQREIDIVKTYKNRRLVELRERSIEFAYKACRRRCASLDELNLVYIDFIEVFNLVSSDLSCFSDAVHPNAQGNEILANSFGKSILMNSAKVPVLRDQKDHDFTQMANSAFVNRDKDRDLAQEVARISKIKPYAPSKGACARETRHAFDADHEHIIEYVTSKLEREQSREEVAALLRSTIANNGAHKGRSKPSFRSSQSPFLYTFY